MAISSLALGKAFRSLSSSNELENAYQIERNAVMKDSNDFNVFSLLIPLPLPQNIRFCAKQQLFKCIFERCFDLSLN